MTGQEYEAYPREISGLNVSVDQMYYEVALSHGRTYSTKRRVRVQAAVDVETGEIRFYIDPEDVARLLPKRSLEPEG